jgi:CDP-glucose 4,6-dehydratase
MLLKGKEELADAWNFGPSAELPMCVLDFVKEIQLNWSRLKVIDQKGPIDWDEVKDLRLDSSKARALLGWRTIWDTKKAIRKAVDWYKSYYDEKEVLTEKQIDEYVSDALEMGIPWARGDVKDS